MASRKFQPKGNSQAFHTAPSAAAKLADQANHATKENHNMNGRLFIRCAFCCGLLLTQLSGAAPADGPADNRPENVRPIPPLGIEVAADKKQELLQRCRQVRELWQPLEQNKKISAADLQPEVLVFPRAVELAIELQQFYKAAELDQAARLLDEAIRRIEVIQAGGGWREVVGLDDGWKEQLIVGGYRSKIDGSFQPYGLVVPAGFAPGDVRPRRLDLWFHGRGETLSELSFLHKQQLSAGQYTPADTFVLHPYGRYSNAFKFAGEIDVLEVLDYIQTRLPVDPTRISVRGFSMGGAACWQFATHYADRFFAANPGAGFSETPEFLASFQGEDARRTRSPVSANTLAALRLSTLGDQPDSLPHGRLQRRSRPPKTSGRRDGGYAGKARYRHGACDRARHRA